MAPGVEYDAGDAALRWEADAALTTPKRPSGYQLHRGGKELNILPHPDQAAVTGACGYTGRYVAKRLLDKSVRVRTLTRKPGREDLFGGALEAVPLDFSDQRSLRRSMEWAGVLSSTYWIRFGRGLTTFERAVENSRLLFDGAARAGGEDRPFLGGPRLAGFLAALFPGQGAGGADSEGRRVLDAIHQADAGLPRLRARQLRRPAHKRRDLSAPGSGCWFWP